MQSVSPRKQNFERAASLFLLAFIFFLVLYLFRGLVLPRKDFYNELWAPAYLLVRGESPYNTAPLHTNLPAAWLPMVIGFFFPLGWLAETPAVYLWYALTIFQIAALVFIIQRKPTLANTLAAAALCFFYPMLLNHINLGQFSVTAMTCWILAVSLSQNKSTPFYEWMSAFLLALALSKPHLGLPAMLGFSYFHYAARGGLRAMLLLWLRTGTAALVLTLPLFIAYPNFIPDMFAAMRSNPVWSYPSLFVLYQRFIPALQYPLWVLTVLSALALNFYLWKKLPPLPALYWSLALVPLVSHYVGSWDFVLLLPLLLHAYLNADWKQKIFLWLAYIIAWALMARVQMLVPSYNHYFWWVPLWFMGASALVTNWKRYEQRDKTKP